MRLNRRLFCHATAFASLRMVFASLFSATACSTAKHGSEPAILSSLSFGSCNKQDMVTMHWPIIASKKAQGWLWMGDAVYADGDAPKIRAQQYQKVLDDKGYRALVEQSFVLGTWDDHDYAANDAGIEYTEKKASQKAFLDFIGEAAASPRRLQEGLYSAKDIGKSETAVQFILLDMRSFKEKASAAADPIGAAQWIWLEQEIAKIGPALKILVSSIQALTDYTGADSWASYPEAQDRLLKLLASSSVPVLILSGDRHLTETTEREVTPGRTLYEITSSGITHTTDHINDNAYSIQEQIAETNFGVLTLEWDATQDPPQLRGLNSAIYSPQSGELIRSFAVPLIWG